MPALTREEIERRLQALPGWSLTEGAISRSFDFASYPEAVAFAVRVALLAEKQDHHPDLLVSYKQVRVSYYTHSENGITKRDLAAAAAVSNL